MARVRLEKGKPAPFTGQLLSDAAVAKLLSEHSAAVEKLKLRIEYLEKRNAELTATQKQVCELQVSTETSKLKLTEEGCKTRQALYETSLQNALKRCERKWYESPYFNFALGAVTFGAVAGGISYAASR